MKVRFALVVGFAGAVFAAPAFGGPPCGFYDSLAPEDYHECPPGCAWSSWDEKTDMPVGLVCDGDYHRSIAPAGWEHDPDVGLPPLDQEEGQAGHQPAWPLDGYPAGPAGGPIGGPALVSPWEMAALLALLIVWAGVREWGD